MTDAPETPEPTVLARARGGLGHLTLNRPRAINALDLDMVAQLSAALDAWQDDPDVGIVLLDGAGDRGLCAGGDVRSLYEQIVGGTPEQPSVFFRAEYTLNARIAEYPHPIVVIADGITMGGGIGLAGHAAVRVVTERSKLAMPETRIGFTPDVGGTWLLAHAPGRIGEYLGVTGATMDAADALYAGFADHLVPAAHLEALRDALETRADPSTPTELVLLFDETAPPSRLAAARPWIDDAFSADTVPEIVARLRARPEAEASATADTIAELSPTGMAVTLEAVRRARELPDLRAALAQEYRLVMW
ncbi:MAG: enoyl-CoA hydratase/isomerase family protein, partial [Microbacterium sp.]|nr:enoyl-CoA hydratase/isomerase family protein [Microbacterium sp.]